MSITGLKVFQAMDDLVKAGKVRCYGVSVERVEEALKAIDISIHAQRKLCHLIRRQSNAFFDSL